MPSPFARRTDEEKRLLNRLKREGRPLNGTRNSVAVELRKLATKEGRPYVPLSRAEADYWGNKGGVTASKDAPSRVAGLLKSGPKAEKGNLGTSNRKTRAYTPSPKVQRNIRFEEARRAAREGLYEPEGFQGILPRATGEPNEAKAAKKAAQFFNRNVKGVAQASLDPQKGATGQMAKGAYEGLTGRPYPYTSNEYPDALSVFRMFSPHLYPLQSAENAYETFREGKPLEKPLNAAGVAADVLFGATAAGKAVRGFREGRQAGRLAEEARAAVPRPQAPPRPEVAPSSVFTPGMNVIDRTGKPGTVVAVAPNQVKIKSGPGVYNLTDADVLSRRITPHPAEPSVNPEAVPQQAAPAPTLPAQRPQTQSPTVAPHVAPEANLAPAATVPDLATAQASLREKIAARKLNQAAPGQPAVVPGPGSLTPEEAARVAERRAGGEGGFVRNPFARSLPEPVRAPDTGAGPGAVPEEDFQQLQAGVEYGQDFGNFAKRGNIASYPEGSADDIIQKGFLAGEDPSEVFARAKYKAPHLTNQALSEKMTRVGYGYGPWYKDESESGLIHLPEEHRNNESLKNEYTTLISLHSAGGSPLMARNKTANMMGAIRRGIKKGTIDLTRTDARGREMNAKALHAEGQTALDGKTRYSYTDSRKAIDGYTDGFVSVAYPLQKTPNYFGALEAGREGKIGVAGVPDRHEMGGSGMPEKKSYKEKDQRVAQARGEVTSANAGFLPATGQAARWQPKKIISDSWARATDRIVLPDGVVIEPGDLIARPGSSFIRHPINDENVALSKVLQSKLEPLTEGYKARIDRGVPEGRAVEQAYAQAEAAGLLDPATMKGLLDKQIQATTQYAQPHFDAIQDLLREMPDIAHPEMQLGYRKKGLTESDIPRSGYIGKEQVEISRRTHQAKREQLISEAPIVRVSFNRGAHPNILSSMKQQMERARPFFDEKTRRLNFLNADHVVVNELGHGAWQGSNDTFMDIAFPGADADALRAYVAELGARFGQDAVAVRFPGVARTAAEGVNPASRAALTMAKGPGQPFTPGEVERFNKIAVEKYGLDPLDTSTDMETMFAPYYGPYGTGDPVTFEKRFNQFKQEVIDNDLTHGHEPMIWGKEKDASSLMGGGGWEPEQYHDSISPTQDIPHPDGPIEAGTKIFNPPNPDGSVTFPHPETGNPVTIPAEVAATFTKDTRTTEALAARGLPPAKDIPNYYPDEDMVLEHTEVATPDVTATGAPEGSLRAGPENLYAGIDFAALAPAEAHALRVRRITQNIEKILMGGGGNLGSNLGGYFHDPQALREVMEDVNAIGAHYVREGTRDFETFARQVYDEVANIDPGVADALRPHLADIWRASLLSNAQGTDAATRAQFARIAQNDVEVPSDLGTERAEPPGQLLQKLNLDPTGEQMVRERIADMPPDPNRTTLEDQRYQARILSDRLRISPDDDLILSEDALRMSGVEINALMNVVSENVEQMETYARILASSDARFSEETKLQAAQVMASLDQQNEHLLNKVVVARSQAGRDLGSLRLLANKSNDPAVWMAKAKQILGPDRPLTDAVRNRIIALCSEIKEVC